MNSHGFDSPSQLALRAICPGSTNLQKSVYDKVSRGTILEDDDISEFAKAGTNKHALSVEHYSGIKDVNDPAMPADVKWTVEKSKEIIAQLPAGATVVMEYRVDLSFLGADVGEVGGQIDLLAVIPGRFAVVIDWKFGVVYVEHPKYNWQLKAYSAAVARSFAVPEVQAYILQPSAMSEDLCLRAVIYKQEDLQQIETEIKDIILKTREPDAPLVRGDHCATKFCKARSYCPQWRDSFLSIPQNDNVASYMSLLPPEKRPELYENLKAAKKFCEIGLDAIKRMVVGGKLEIPGYVVGEGRKTREWKDIDLAIQQLKLLSANITAQHIRVVEPISPAQAEDIFGENAIEPLVKIVVGNPTVKKEKKK